MEFKITKYFEMIKFMSMAKCNHVHNWQFKIYDNHSIEIIRDDKVVARTVLEMPDCETFTARQLDSEGYNDQLAKEYGKTELTIVNQSPPTTRKESWNFKSLLGLKH